MNKICPICKKETLIKIVYGRPTEELMDLVNKNLIHLGTCNIISDNTNNYYCLTCKNEINIKE